MGQRNVFFTPQAIKVPPTPNMRGRVAVRLFRWIAPRDLLLCVKTGQ